jgi:hypothetical protein
MIVLNLVGQLKLKEVVMAKKKKKKEMQVSPKRYRELRDRYMRGEELTASEMNEAIKQADLIAQSLKDAEYMEANDIENWNALPPSLQKEVQDYRAAKIAEEDAPSKFRQVMGPLFKLGGKAAGTAAAVASGHPELASVGAEVGGAGAETSAGIMNLLFPGAVRQPQTQRERILARQRRGLEGAPIREPRPDYIPSAEYEQAYKSLFTPLPYQRTFDESQGSMADNPILSFLRSGDQSRQPDRQRSSLMTILQRLRGLTGGR